MGPDVLDRPLEAAPPRRSVAAELFAAGCAAVVFALYVRTFLFQAFEVPTPSMEKTVLVGDHLLVNKFVFAPHVGGPLARLLPYRSPRRGDVFVFKYPENPQRDFVKRAIGMPGDVVEIRDKEVFVNGARQSEPRIFHSDDLVRPDDPSLPDAYRRRDQLPSTAVPRDAVFALGDNRDDSSDSRFWGLVPAGYDQGAAALRLLVAPAGERTAGRPPAPRNALAPNAMGADLAARALESRAGIEKEVEMERTRARGEGRVGCVIWLVIVGIVGYCLFKIVPVKVANSVLRRLHDRAGVLRLHQVGQADRERDSREGEGPRRPGHEGEPRHHQEPREDLHRMPLRDRDRLLRRPVQVPLETRPRRRAAALRRCDVRALDRRRRAADWHPGDDPALLREGAARALHRPEDTRRPPALRRSDRSAPRDSEAADPRGACPFGRAPRPDVGGERSVRARPRRRRTGSSRISRPGCSPSKHGSLASRRPRRGGGAGFEGNKAGSPAIGEPGRRQTMRRSTLALTALCALGLAAAALAEPRPSAAPPPPFSSRPSTASPST